MAIVAFVLADASAVEDDCVVRSREGYLFVLGSATIALPTNQQMRTTGSIAPGFKDITDLYRRATSLTSPRRASR